MRSPRGAAPSKARIADYWMEYECAGNALPWAGPSGFDLGEPACMACERFVPDWETCDGEWDSRVWNKTTGLEKCHVVAHFRGGSDTDPSNFVLMCRPCHKQSGDPTDPRALFSWMRHQRKEVLGLTPTALALWHELSKATIDKYNLGSDFSMPSNTYELVRTCLARYSVGESDGRQIVHDDDVLSAIHDYFDALQEQLGGAR